MARFWKEPHKVTAFPGQPYSKATIAYVKKHYGTDLMKAPFFGKAIAYEAAAPVLTALSGIPGIVARIDRHKREGIRVHLVPKIKPYTEWTIVFAHLGKVLVKNGQGVGYDTPIGMVSKAFKFTGVGTDNHIAIYAWKFVRKTGVVNPDVRVIEKVMPPKPAPKPPVKPVEPVSPPKPVVEPTTISEPIVINDTSYQITETEVWWKVLFRLIWEKVKERFHLE